MRIAAARLDSLLLQAEEMSLFKIAAGQRAAEARRIERSLLSLRAESERPEERGASGGSLLDGIEVGAVALARSLEGDLRSIKAHGGRASRGDEESRDDAGSLVHGGFPQVGPRSRAAAQGKEADVVVRGDEIEIDKRVLEEIKDPLIHLLRNCVDHGMRVPKERVAQGKAPARDDSDRLRRAR